MLFTQVSCVVKNTLLLFWSVCCGFFVAVEEHLPFVWKRMCGVVSAAFVLVAGLSRVRCLSDCCWLGCRSRGEGGRGSCWLLESAAQSRFP